MRQRAFVRSIVLALLAIGCGQRSTETASSESADRGPDHLAARLSVYTVNYPLTYFAERIGGDAVQVNFPAPREVDPAYWDPDPEQVAAYQSADLILLNGATYAKWIERASLPANRLVDTGAGSEDRWIALAESTVHSHGLEGEHSHTGWAFTTWLDPELAMAQASRIAEAIIQERPDREAEIRQSLAAVEADWQDLDRALEGVAEQIGDRAILFSHPVYQYLERRYSLDGRSVHWEPGEVPSASQWQELESLLAGRPAAWMVWESQPLQETEQRLGELGIECVVFNPCGNTPETGDLLSVMRENVAALERIGTSK